MSQATAGVVGSKGSSFSITIDSGTIMSAYLEVPNQPILALQIGAGDREVTIPNLPAGDSTVRLDLVWAPGDTNGTVDIGTVTSGTVKTADPKPILDDGDTPGYIELFGV